MDPSWRAFRMSSRYSSLESLDGSPQYDPCDGVLEGDFALAGLSVADLLSVDGLPGVVEEVLSGVPVGLRDVGLEIVVLWGWVFTTHDVR